MISRYIVSLDGISLESLHNAILITDVQYPDVVYQRETIGSVKRDGARIHRTYKEKSEVSVSFAIRAYDIVERQRICQAVCKWAKRGGRLQINDREGQFLDCICDSLPAVNSTLGWTDTLEIKFVAYAIPYWQDLIPTYIEMTGSSGEEGHMIPGSAPWTFVEATITPKATLTTIAIGINGLSDSDSTLFYLDGMSISSGSQIKIAYDQNAILSIKQGTTSLLEKHSGKDDLVAGCGEVNTFSYVADANCDVTFKIRGYWE